MDNWEDYWEDISLYRSNKKIPKAPEEELDATARVYSERGLLVMCILLSAYKIYIGSMPYDVLTLFWGYMSAGFYARYRIGRKSTISLICSLFATLAFGFLYVIHTI